MWRAIALGCVPVTFFRATELPFARRLGMDYLQFSVNLQPDDYRSLQAWPLGCEAWACISSAEGFASVLGDISCERAREAGCTCAGPHAHVDMVAAASGFLLSEQQM